MQNAGHFGPGAASAQPPSQFVPSEPSPNGGSTTSSLRQFRKKDVDKSHVEQQPPKQMSESHVARVAPHNHYPPPSNDTYRYPPHQFSSYSSQVKYSDLAEASQPNPISTSVIQKPKSKDYMEMCNVQQQQHLNNHQQYSPPDNGQYMHKDPGQGYPTGFKSESHFFSKEQHQYQQLPPHHPGAQKFNAMMTQNMRKYNPAPADNPFLNKLSKIRPSMARSIISDHHLQDTQPAYPPMDQRGMYGQQNHRYYSGSMHQPNPYSPNPNYHMNAPHPYANPYPSASCSYSRSPQMGSVPPRYPHHMERSISPGRRAYPEGMHMSHMNYHAMHQKMSPGLNYPPQYNRGPEYAQHYQHRRMPQDCFPQSLRPAQYMQNHHQIAGQDMQELTESTVSPSDSLKKFIENWADEEPSSEMNPMEANMNLRDKLRDDVPAGTVYMINATDVQYFENNGIPIVSSDTGGFQLTSENYQYLLKNGLVDNSGMVRIIEANKEIAIDSNGTQERIVNLQIMEAPKSDCMMANKHLRLPDGNPGQSNLLPKQEDESRRVVIHQNTVLNPGIVNDRPNVAEIPLHQSVVDNLSITKELVDKNCSPINLDHLEHNLGFSEPEQLETESDPISPKHSNLSTDQQLNLSDDLSQNSDDSQYKSPGSKSMPIIDFFGEPPVVDTKENDEKEEKPDVTESEVIPSLSSSVIVSQETIKTEPATSETAEKLENKTEKLDLDDEESKPDISSDNNSPVAVAEDTETAQAPVERRKRIFSVDDIIHNIGNNAKKGSNEFESTTCRFQATADFIENEVGFSSLEQMQPTITIEKEIKMEVDKEPEPPALIKQETSLGSNQANFRNVLRVKGSSAVLQVAGELMEISVNIVNGKKVINVTPLADSTTVVDYNDNYQVSANIPSENVSDVSGNKDCERASVREEAENSEIISDVSEHKDCDVDAGNNEIFNAISGKSCKEDLVRENAENSAIGSDVAENNDSVGDAENNEIVSDVSENKNCEGDSVEEVMEDAESNKVVRDDSKNKLDEEVTSDAENNEIIKTEHMSDEFIETIKREVNENEKPQNMDKLEDTKHVEDPIVNIDNSISPQEAENTVPNDTESQDVVKEVDGHIKEHCATESQEIMPEQPNTTENVIVSREIELKDSQTNDTPMVTECPQELDRVEQNCNAIETKIDEKDAMNTDDGCGAIESQENDSEHPETKDIEESNMSSNYKNSPSKPEDSRGNEEDSRETEVLLEGSLLPEKPKEVMEDIIDKHSECLEEHKDEDLPENPIGNNADNYDTKKEDQADEIEVLKETLDISAAAENINCESIHKILDNDMEIEIQPQPSDLNEAKDLESQTEEAKEPESIESDLGLEEIGIRPDIAEKRDKDAGFLLDITEKNDEGTVIEPDKTDEEAIIQPDITEKVELEVFQSIESVSVAEPLDNQTTIEEVAINETLEPTNTELDVGNDEVSQETIYLEENVREDTHAEVVHSEEAEAIYDIEGNPTELVMEDNDDDDEDIIYGVDFPLEDEVFIADPPAHEVVVSDPLEGIGVVDERDSPVIPLEPVTTTEKVAVTDGEDLNASKPAEVVIKVSKPEVQILSPTSTNIEDHTASSKSNNVYLDLRRKYSTDNDVSEYVISSPVTTKAAKKLYESDLMVQHDIVSSSKKEEAPKQSSKKSGLKRSKRLNEKVQVKNEQKEMLRILADKRKRRKELRQKESSKPEKESDASVDKIEREPEKEKEPSEHDEEFVDFKELLRARKLKKLKKLQESKTREAKEAAGKVKNNKSDTNKDIIKIKQSVASNSHGREKNNANCCIGCSDSTVLKKSKSFKEEKHDKIRKTSKSSESETATTSKAATLETKPEINETVPILKPVVSKIDSVNSKIAEKIKPQKRVSFSDEFPSSTSSAIKTPILEHAKPASHGMHPKDPRRKSKTYTSKVMVPSVSELMEENNVSGNKKKISLADYVSRKRKATCTDNKEKRHKLDSAGYERTDSTESSKSEESITKIIKTLKDVKTSFVIHSSDWEDSNSPAPTPIQSKEQCLIQDFSGLINNNSKKPVIDVNELTLLENHKDRKLQEYKDKVDSQLSSLNIQIPKIKPHSSEGKSSCSKINLGPYRSPETSNLVTRFLKSDKLSMDEMEKIKEIIHYKRSMQRHLNNGKSPSKSPAESNSSSSILYTDSSPDPSYEVARRNSRLETDLNETRLHLKKVNAKRKLQLTSDEEDSSPVTTSQKKNDGYSVYNRLGEDGLPKIIFKRNKKNLTKEPVVELVKLDLDNLEKVKEKYNVTVRQMM